MRKRILAIMLTLVLVLGLAACGEMSSSQEPQQNASEALSMHDDTENAAEITDEATGNENEAEEAIVDGTDAEEEAEVSRTTMNVSIGDVTFTATLEENAAVDELVTMMEKEPIVLSLSDYSGFEKVGPLGRSLTTSNVQMTTTAGDIVLYSGNQIVMFYGSNSWSYTLLAHVDDLTGWADALGSGDVTVTLSLE